MHQSTPAAKDLELARLTNAYVCYLHPLHLYHVRGPIKCSLCSKKYIVITSILCGRQTRSPHNANTRAARRPFPHCEGEWLYVAGGGYSSELKLLAAPPSRWARDVEGMPGCGCGDLKLGGDSKRALSGTVEVTTTKVPSPVNNPSSSTSILRFSASLTYCSQQHTPRGTPVISCPLQVLSCGSAATNTPRAGTPVTKPRQVPRPQ